MPLNHVPNSVLTCSVVVHTMNMPQSVAQGLSAGNSLLQVVLRL